MASTKPYYYMIGAEIARGDARRGRFEYDDNVIRRRARQWGTGRFSKAALDLIVRGYHREMADTPNLNPSTTSRGWTKTKAVRIRRNASGKATHIDIRV